MLKLILIVILASICLVFFCKTTYHQVWKKSRRRGEISNFVAGLLLRGVIICQRRLLAATNLSFDGFLRNFLVLGRRRLKLRGRVWARRPPVVVFVCVFIQIVVVIKGRWRGYRTYRVTSLTCLLSHNFFVLVEIKNLWKLI